MLHEHDNDEDCADDELERLLDALQTTNNFCGV